MCLLRRLINAKTVSSGSSKVSGWRSIQRSPDSREAKKKWKWQAVAMIRTAEVASHSSERRQETATYVGFTVSMRPGDIARRTN